MSTLKANTIQPVSSGVPLVVDSSLRVNGNTSIMSLLAGSATESPTAPLTIRGGGVDSNTLTLYTRNGVNSYGMRIFEDADTSEWVRFRAMSGNSNSADTAGLQKGFWFSPDDDSCALSIWTRTKGGKVGVYAAADDTSARLKVGIGDYLSLTDYCADFTSDSNDGGWGGILFSQNSTNAFKLWTQGTGIGSGTGRLVLGYVNRSTGALTGGGFESETGPSSGGVWNPVLMEIRHDTGLVRVNSLSLQNFGGDTNVMVKPNNTASVVGQVIPLLRGNHITNVAHQAVTALPAGTWFVYLTAADNSATSGGQVDEDLHFCMAKVWTVPAGQFLRFGNLAKTPTATDTTMGYWLDGSDTVKSSSSGFTEFKTTATGDAKAWQANGGNISATNAPSVFYDSGSADGPSGLLNWAGYAIRIA